MITYSIHDGETSKGTKNRLVITYPKRPDLVFDISNTFINSKLVRTSQNQSHLRNPENMVEIVALFTQTWSISDQSKLYNIMASVTSRIMEAAPDQVEHTITALAEEVLDIGGFSGLGSPDGPINQWVCSVARKPSTVHNSMADAPTSYDRSQTYLTKEYMALVEFSIYVKAILPIMSTSLPRLEDRYRTKSTMKLLAAIIVPSLYNNPGYLRLMAYIKDYSDKNYGGSTPGKVLGNIDKLLFDGAVSFEELVEYVASEVITKRLPSSRVLRDNESSHPIVRMYSRLSGIKDSSKIVYADKDIGSKSKGGDTLTTTVGDEYRLKDVLSVDVQCQVMWIVNSQYLSQHTGIPKQQIDRLMDKITQSSELPTIDEFQQHIIRIRLGHIIVNAALPLLSHQQIILLAVVCHLLLQENHPELSAVMCSSRAISLTTGQHVPVMESPVTVTKSLMQELNHRYPFNLSVKTTLNGRKQTVNLKISTLLKEVEILSKFKYVCYLSPECLSPPIKKHFTGKGLLTMPGDTINYFARLLLDMRSWLA